MLLCITSLAPSTFPIAQSCLWSLLKPLIINGTNEAVIHLWFLHYSVGMGLIDVHSLLHTLFNQLKISLSFSRATSITLCPHHQLQMFLALLSGHLSFLALNRNWEAWLDQRCVFLMAPSNQGRWALRMGGRWQACTMAVVHLPWNVCRT